MDQKFLHIIAGDSEAALSSELTKAGFQVGPSGRMSGGLNVRVRSESNDETTVTDIVNRIAPKTSFGPSGAPTTHS